MDREFAEKLVGRISSTLPPEASSSIQFDSFNVGSAFRGGDGKEAVVNFTARHNGVEDVFMTATGSFVPAGCQVGKLVIRVGSNPMDKPVFVER